MGCGGSKSKQKEEPAHEAAHTVQQADDTSASKSVEAEEVQKKDSGDAGAAPAIAEPSTEYSGDVGQEDTEEITRYNRAGSLSGGDSAEAMRVTAVDEGTQNIAQEIFGDGPAGLAEPQYESSAVPAASSPPPTKSQSISNSSPYVDESSDDDDDDDDDGIDRAGKFRAPDF